MRFRNPGGINGAALSPDGKLIATVSSRSVLRLIDTATGQTRLTLRDLPRQGFGDGQCLLSFSPDGKALLTSAGYVGNNAERRRAEEDDLLEISRITSGKLQLRKERVELAAIIRSAVEGARPLIEAQGHELTVTLKPEPVHLNADPMRLAQVFSNLLTNAAKYTDKGGHIWLTAERLDGESVVSVRDTGIGIAAEHLLPLFEMFSQVEPALERSQGGLGIGLFGSDGKQAVPYLVSISTWAIRRNRAKFFFRSTAFGRAQEGVFGRLDLSRQAIITRFSGDGDDAPRAAAFLKGGHGLPLSDGNASPMSPGNCCLIFFSTFSILSYHAGFLASGKLGN